MTQDQTTPTSMYCRKCGYQLGGMSENRCPECGEQFAPTPHGRCSSGQIRLLRHLSRICLIAIALLLFGLAAYQRSSIEYMTGDRRFRIVVHQTIMGLPAWLVYNADQIEGRPPPFNDRYMPEANRYAPGLHLQVMPLAISGVGSLVVGSVLYVLVLSLSRHKPKRSISAIGYGSAVAVACGTGIALASNPHDISLVALAGILIVLPTVLIFWAGHAKQYLHTIALAAVSVAILWWTARMADHLQEQHGYRGVEVGADLVLPLVGVALYAAVGCLTVLIARRRIPSQLMPPVHRP
jgi:hypothetical protein